VVDARVDAELRVGAVVEEERQALAGGELARLVLLGGLRLPAAERRGGAPLGELLDEGAQERRGGLFDGGHERDSTTPAARPPNPGRRLGLVLTVL
jgi:hypothetical protein